MILQLHIKNGKIVAGKEMLEKFLKHTMNGVYTARFHYTGQPKTIAESRKYYFFICEMIANEGDMGYKAKEIHSIFKDNVLKNIPDLIHMTTGEPMDYMDFSNPLNPTIKYSTKMLSLEGWNIYIDAVKQYAKEQMDFLI